MQRANDEKEKDKVIAKFDQWVADLTMPYFKEHRGSDGAFKHAENPSEEEKQLKKLMCAKLTCNKIRYSRLCDQGVPLWSPRQNCKKMLKGLHYSHSAEDWLDFVEGCWNLIEELPQKNMIVRKVIDKLVTLEHFERLERWSFKTFGDRNRIYIVAKNRKSEKRAPKGWYELLKVKREKVNAATECKDVFFDTVKHIFNDKYTIKLKS